MNCPLIITDESGNLLYKSGRISPDSAFRAQLCAVSAGGARGIVPIGSFRAYVKEILLCGKRYLFFLDFDRLCECYGASAAPRAADGLFDVSAYAKDGAKEISLRSLSYFFADTYNKVLQAEGVRMEMRALAVDTAVRVSPMAFALALALTVRLCAVGGANVRLSVANDNGRVSIFADCVGGDAVPASERAFLEVLLREACAAAGFDISPMRGKTADGYALSLSPLDISLLGLKTDPLQRYTKTFAFIVELFS